MGNFNSLVSIIIPAFNAEGFIGETLNSILVQTYPQLEIIVVDDGSTDQTASIVQGYGSGVIYLRQENSGGCSVPRNTGIKHSSGEFLCFMDADDLMVPDRIASQVDFLRRHPHVGMVFCDYRNFDTHGLFVQSHFETCPLLWQRLKARDELIIEDACALLAQENFGIAGSLLMRRDALQHASGFEPSLKSCEDFHFYFRLARNMLGGVINKVGMLRRIHGGNISGNVLKMRAEGIRSRSMLKETEESPEIRKHLDRYIANCNMGLARQLADHGHFIESFRYDLRVLASRFLWPETGKACRNIVRTIAMAAGLFTPEKSEHQT